VKLVLQFFQISLKIHPIVEAQDIGCSIRAARILVDWDAGDLAKQIGMSRVAIQNIERGDARPKAETMDKIVHAFFDVGIEFTENEGLRRRPEGIEIFEGPERFDEFYDFLYEHLKRNGGEVCLNVADERLLSQYRKDPGVHYKRMKALCDNGMIKSFRILATESKFAPTYSTYKWQSGAGISPTAFYAFGDCLALISFVHTPAPYVVVLKSPPLAAAYRQAFDGAWATAKEPPPPSLEENKL